MTPLQDGWVKFLEPMGFDCFFTITYRLPARSWTSAIWRAKKFLIRYYSGRGERARAFIVAEPHELGHYHVHGLLDTHGSFELRRHLWAACKNRHGICRFEPLDDKEAVRIYVTKYCLKESSAWDLIGIRKVGDIGGPAL